jgi:hypothetical protein
MSYIDIVICVGRLPYLETWPPIYRGQERMVRDRLRVSQSSPYVYFRYTPCLTDFTFEFIRRPIPPILSPSYWTFVELTLVNAVDLALPGSKIRIIVLDSICNPPGAPSPLTEVWTRVHGLSRCLLEVERLKAALEMVGKPILVDNDSLLQDPKAVRV